MAKEKKISAAKQKIIDNYEQQKSSYLQQGYEEKQEVLSILKANIMAVVIAVPLAVLGLILWITLKENGSARLSFESMILFLIIFFALVYVHEVLHGVGWCAGAKSRWKSIYIGIMRDSMTPYCHCREPLTPAKYLIGVLTPASVLGAGFYILAFITDSNLLLELSMLNLLAAGGDLAISILVFKYMGKKVLILDHPTECGFVAFTKE